MPVLLGVLGEADAFSEGQLGELGAAYSAGATLVALTSVVWMRGLHVRLPVALFLTAGFSALAGAAFAARYSPMLVTFLVAGVGFGGVYALMIALLAQTDDPNRSVGWQWGFGSLPGMFLLYAIPALAVPGGSAQIAFALTAGMNVVMALAAVALPDRLRSQQPNPRRAGATGDVPVIRFRVWIGLFVVFAVYLGITGGWSFLGRIAMREGIPGQYAGVVLAIATAASSLVALLAGEIGEIGARRGSMTAAVTAMLGGLALIAYWPTRLGYAIGAIVFIGLATYALTFSIGIISRLNTDQRASGLPAAALGVGSILGPAIAGHVYQADGARTMLLACGLSLIAGLIGYITVYGDRR